MYLLKKKYSKQLGQLVQHFSCMEQDSVLLLNRILKGRKQCNGSRYLNNAKLLISFIHKERPFDIPNASVQTNIRTDVISFPRLCCMAIVGYRSENTPYGVYPIIIFTISKEMVLSSIMSKQILLGFFSEWSMKAPNAKKKQMTPSRFPAAIEETIFAGMSPKRIASIF